MVSEVKCSVTYIPARLRAARKERQWPCCEHVRLPPAVKGHGARFRPMKLSSGYQRLVRRPTVFDPLLYLYCVDNGTGKLASNCARWARLSQKQIAIAIAICAFLYTFSRFLRLAVWVFGHRENCACGQRATQPHPPLQDDLNVYGRSELIRSRACNHLEIASFLSRCLNRSICSLVLVVLTFRVDYRLPLPFPPLGATVAC